MEIIAIGRLAWIMSMTIIVLTLLVSVEDDDHDRLHFSLYMLPRFSLHLLLILVKTVFSLQHSRKLIKFSTR